MLFILFTTSVFAAYMQPVPMGANAPPPQQQQQSSYPMGANATPPQQPVQIHYPNQPVQTQQSSYPNVLTTPIACEQVLDPTFCKGPALMSGYVCSWQENECESVDLHEMKNESEAPEREMPEMEVPENEQSGDMCKMLSTNQFACLQKPGCLFEDFECKMAEGEVSFNGAVPNGAFNTNGGHGVFPQGTMPMGAQPAPALPVQPAPQPAPARPGTVFTPQPNTMAPQPIYPAQSVPQAQSTQTPTGPQFCASLPEIQCFGPSMMTGELCMWDAEDYECVTASEADMEAICNQFYRDPAKCDQHENCFWDEVDQECSENTYPAAGVSDKPVLSQICSHFTDVMACASHAKCFWDSIAANGLGLCVNVIQAANVCRVLDTAIHCSTNALCHWNFDRCQASAGLQLQAAHQQKAKAQAEVSSTWEQDLMVGAGASVLGLTVGIFFSWAHSKWALNQVSNEDYRDIMMDMNSQVREIV